MQGKGTKKQKRVNTSRVVTVKRARFLSLRRDPYNSPSAVLGPVDKGSLACRRTNGIMDFLFCRGLRILHDFPYNRSGGWDCEARTNPRGLRGIHARVLTYCTSHEDEANFLQNLYILLMKKFPSLFHLCRGIFRFTRKFRRNESSR